MQTINLFQLVTVCCLMMSLAATSDQKMRAVCVVDGALKLSQIERPTPGDGELLVRVHAAGVNPVDWKIAKGGMRRGGADASKPFVVGFDVSGVVESVGANVTNFKAGDAVFAMLDLRRGGGYAEYAIVREQDAVAKPQAVSYVDAAAVPLAALTAWQALVDIAKLEKGQTVLIHAGAGGVGSFAIQIAKSRGAKVIATASKENLEFLKDLGADVTIDYRNQKFEELAKDADVILDSVGGDTQERSIATLKKGGTLVSIVGVTTKAKADEAGVRAIGMLVKSNGEELAQIAKLIQKGAIKPVVSKTFSLDDAAKAHELSEGGHVKGKIVLKVRED